MSNTHMHTQTKKHTQYGLQTTQCSSYANELYYTARIGVWFTYTYNVVRLFLEVAEAVTVHFDRLACA